MIRSLSRKQKLTIAVVVVLLVAAVAAAVTFWMVGPAVRCALPERASVEEGWTARSVVSGGHDRCYYIYVPPGQVTAQLAPVVFSFHGFLSNPESQALISGWHELADQQGFLVVYPQGKKFPQRWNAGANWGNEDVDDVLFFRDMLDDLDSVAAVDRSRVYVNGFSNGGGVTVRIGCEAAELLAAIGTVAGAIVSMDGCTPSRSVPAMAFHGTADRIVPYAGGPMTSSLLRWGPSLLTRPGILSAPRIGSPRGPRATAATPRPRRSRPKVT